MAETIFLKHFSEVGLPDSGRDKSKHFCPKCHMVRTDKRDKSLTISYSKGVAFCHYCEVTYAIKQESDSFKPVYMKQYKKPSWRNNTQLSDKMVKYWEGRKINQTILKELNITEGMEFMPQFGKEVNTVQFNYFVDGDLVNVKYRTGDKKFKLCPDAELVPYNIDSLLGRDKAICVEGEVDCMSFLAIGYKNCISVPNGASDNTSYLDRFMEKYFDDKEVIYIAADTDNKGVTLRNALIARFGAERCKIVEYVDDCKDANEVLCKHGELALRECLDKAKYVPVDGVFELDDIEDDLDLLFSKGLNKGAVIGLETFDNLCSFETKRLVVVTGIPTSGKTEFLEEMAIRLNLRYGWKVGFFSPESLPIQLHAARIISRVVGKSFGTNSIPANEYAQSKAYTNDNYFFVEPESYDLDVILDKFKFLVRRKGIKIAVIDPYNALSINESAGNTAEQVREMLDKMQRFARRNDVLFFLMAHPKNMQKGTDGLYPVPTLYDISGGANFFNKADFGITVHRNMAENLTEIHVQKVKFLHLGNKGMTSFAFNINNHRYTERQRDGSIKWDNSNWLVSKNKEDCELASKASFEFHEISEVQSIYDSAYSSSDDLLTENKNPLPF